MPLFSGVLIAPGEYFPGIIVVVLFYNWHSAMPVHLWRIASYFNLK
jgi:hypothetical protein